MMHRIGSESCFAHPHEMFLPPSHSNRCVCIILNGVLDEKCFRAIPLSVLAIHLEIGWNAAVIGKMHLQCTSLWGAMKVHKPMTQRLEPPGSSIGSAPPSHADAVDSFVSPLRAAACMSPAPVKDMHTCAWLKGGRLADSNPAM